MNKFEIALELTKLSSAYIIKEENKKVETDFPKAFADAYNKIYETITISDSSTNSSTKSYELSI